MSPSNSASSKSHISANRLVNGLNPPGPTTHSHKSVWTIPAYGPDGVRHRGSANLFQALALNCGKMQRL